jgi:hypothetical protein
MIAMGTPLLKQTLPEHILSTDVRRNQAAADYYSLVVARMHLDQAQRSAQSDWVEGVRTPGRGDEQLSHAIQSVSIIHPKQLPGAGSSRRWRPFVMPTRRSATPMRCSASTSRGRRSGCRRRSSTSTDR